MNTWIDVLIEFTLAAIALYAAIRALLAWTAAAERDELDVPDPAAAAVWEVLAEARSILDESGTDATGA